MESEDLRHFDFGLRCRQCAWRVLGKDRVRLDPEGAYRTDVVRSREDGEHRATVFRDPVAVGPHAGRSYPKGTPVLCPACGALGCVPARFLPFAAPLWKRWARRLPCPSCGSRGVLPLAAQLGDPMDLMILPFFFGTAATGLLLRLHPTGSLRIDSVLCAAAGLVAGLGGFLLAVLRWGRTQNRLEDWFESFPCPKCGARALVHQRALGTSTAYCHLDDPFGDWESDRFLGIRGTLRKTRASSRVGPSKG